MAVGAGRNAPNGVPREQRGFEIEKDSHWFDDPYYDFLNHILLAGLEVEEREWSVVDHFRLLHGTGHRP